MTQTMAINIIEDLGHFYGARRFPENDDSESSGGSISMEDHLCDRIKTRNEHDYRIDKSMETLLDA